MIFGIKKIYNFDPYNVFLANVTIIPVLLKTGFVLQGHMHIHVNTSQCISTDKCCHM